MAGQPHAGKHTPGGTVRWDYTDRFQPQRQGRDGPPEDAELIGMLFSTAKELRHVAEQHFGQLFVPTRVVWEDAHAAVFELRVADLGAVIVNAERERRWYPFRVVRVERTAMGRAAS